MTNTSAAESSQPKICVCGSINMDLVIETPQLPFPGETVMARRLNEIPGGKGANQAVGAARLGAEVLMVGRVGDDTYGTKLLANLEREGIRSTYLQTIDGSSGVAIVAVEDSGENSIMVVPGANGRLMPEDISSDAIAGCDVLLLQLEIPMPTVLHAIELAKRFKKTILMNPAPAPMPFDDRLLDVDVFCPNRTEAERILHKRILNRDDALLAVQSLVTLGAKNAIITLGEEGLVIATKNKQPAYVPPFEVSAVDTTAAGDAFMAALAFQLARKADFNKAVQYASAAGAYAATIAGAQPSLPTRENVSQILEQDASRVLDTI